MGELELVGLHDDGEHLILATPDGQQHRLRIDEPLRAAVRRDRPQLEQLRAERASALSPREIQARIRAGATAQEVAESAGLSLVSVRRYEGPVLAEREYVAELARDTAVRHETGAPTLGDLVTDRLAARGVDVATLSWDAAREGSAPWTVIARFEVGGEDKEAQWAFDTTARSLTAAEDEARWLSETELDEPVARRHLSAVRDVVFDLPASLVEPPTPADEPEPAPDPTAAMLDDLRARRGHRQPLQLDDDGEFEGFGPQHAFDFGNDAPGAHPEDAEPAAQAKVYAVPAALEAVPDLPTEQLSVPDEQPAVPAAPAPEDRPRTRRGRAKVPSWDEIVFGAKPE
jgi:DNA-binding CsgD family transcriptional regulator